MQVSESLTLGHGDATDRFEFDVASEARDLTFCLFAQFPSTPSESTDGPDRCLPPTPMQPTRVHVNAEMWNSAHVTDREVVLLSVGLTAMPLTCAGFTVADGAMLCIAPT